MDTNNLLKTKKGKIAIAAILVAIVLVILGLLAFTCSKNAINEQQEQNGTQESQDTSMVATPGGTGAVQATQSVTTTYSYSLVFDGNGGSSIPDVTYKSADTSATLSIPSGEDAVAV